MFDTGPFLEHEAHQLDTSGIRWLSRAWIVDERHHASFFMEDDHLHPDPKAWTAGALPDWPVSLASNDSF